MNATSTKTVYNALVNISRVSGVSMLKLLLPICFLAIAAISGNIVAQNWSNELALESTFFVEAPRFPEQHDNGNLSLSLQPEYYTSWDNRDQSLEFIPFARLDYQDSERTHIDVRELAWTKVYDSWEVRAGISRVFWGVTEFQHLVDVINQTDLVENIDGEDKLGQPMVLLTAIQDWGTLEFYALPYFRDRTFSGEDNRLRTPFVVDTDLAEYESSREQYHTDFAIRYSHYFGDWDIGLAQFAGTNREPILSIEQNSAGDTVFAPYYEQMQQTSIDIQATKSATLWKLEALHRNADSGTVNAIAGGLEYSFYGIADSVADLGIIAEYHYDNRGEQAPTIFEDDIALGARLALNDAQSTEMLAGLLFDRSSGGNSISIEGSRRINNNLLFELESRFFNNAGNDDPLSALSEDDFIRANLVYSF